MKLGLKLYSTNVELIAEARRLKEKEFFEYIELYTIPHSYEKTIDDWKALNIPFVIHAPHSFHGINLAQADMWETNQRNFKEAQLFADSLGADTIIVHGGNNGSFAETLRQITLLNEKRIALENKPKFGQKKELCIGWSPAQFQQAVDDGFSNAFILDFAHAAYAANSLNIDTMEIIRGFVEFKPKIFHLSDGEKSSEIDIHLNLGKGSLDLTDFLSVVPGGALMTIETPRNQSNGLEEFVKDVNFLRKLLSLKE